MLEIPVSTLGNKVKHVELSNTACIKAKVRKLFPA